jgi:NTE family protein
MKVRILVISVFILGLLISSFQLYSQKVGVVMSGGGAKGACHIGFLKALEEHNIPIDYVAGTSMGAIIAGLYAAGYTPDEMAYFVAAPEFQDWADGVINPNYIYFYKKEDDNASMVRLNFDYTDSFKARIPTNLVSPYEMDYQFMEVFASANAAAGGNFDSLFVPFRCIASDITQNKAAILRDGDLSMAIRASMTFPFYFKPIKIDGKVMFDGGMYNNFPADVMYEDFKPNVILGCKAAGNYSTPKVDDLISQLENMLMLKSSYEIPIDSSVLIAPHMPQVEVNDFSHSLEFVDSGYLATSKQIEKIESLIQRRVTSEERELRRAHFRDRKPLLFVDSIDVIGVNNAQKEYVRQMLLDDKKPKLLGEIKEDYFRLISDKEFGSIYPSLVYKPKTGGFTLKLDAVPTERFEAQIGGSIMSTGTNTVFLQLKYRDIRKIGRIALTNAYIGRFYSSFYMKGRVDYPGKKPYFLDLDFTFNRINYFKNSSYFIADLTPSYLIRSETHGGFRYGIPITNKGQLTAGLDVGTVFDEYYQINVFSRDDESDQTRFNFIMPSLTLEINSENEKQYANAGSRFFAEFRFVNGVEKFKSGTYLGQDEKVTTNHSWIQLNLKYSNYFASFKKIKFGLQSEFQISSQPFFSNYTSTLLSLPQYAPMPYAATQFLPDFRTPSFIAAGSKNIYRMAKLVDFRFEGYIYQPLYSITGKDYYTPKYGKFLEGTSFMATGGFVVNTIIGPISLMFNYFDKEADNFSVVLSIGYIMFNKRLFI